MAGDRHAHDFRFDGDDPYLICGCGARRDALTGRPLASEPASQATPEGRVWDDAVQEWRVGSSSGPLASPATPEATADAAWHERIRMAVHDYFQRERADDQGEYGPGCIHFDKGFGLFRLCDDPDQDVPIRALPEVLAAIRAAEPEALDRITQALTDALAANHAHIQHETSGYDMPVAGIARDLAARLSDSEPRIPGGQSDGG